MKKNDLKIILPVIILIIGSFILKTGYDNYKEKGSGSSYCLIKYGKKSLKYDLKKYAGKDITIDQGNGKVNVIHITESGVYMKDSSCKNHDCIKQGEVTPENIHKRALENKIICLPNKLVVELIPDKEAEQ